MLASAHEHLGGRAMGKTIELRVDVTTEAAVDGPAELAVTIHLPAASTLPERPVVAFGFPGGGYSRRYYAMDLPGWPAGGQAAYHTDRGWVFVAIDHLQVGDSTLFEPDLLTMEQIARANQAAVNHVLATLAAGSLGDLPAIERPFTIAMGQSMGGCFLIVHQGQLRSFDAVAVLGYSAVHTAVPSRPGTPNLPMPWMVRASLPHNPIILNPEVMEALMVVRTSADLAHAVGEHEHMWTWAFHHDDEPRDVVAQDMDALSGGPLPTWRSATTPACAVLGVAPGSVATEAAAINVPVFLGMGVQDVLVDPDREPAAYKSSPEVVFARFPQMAHMHNFAPTREHLWSRLHRWVQGLAG